MIDVKGKRVFLSGPITGMPHHNVGVVAEACGIECHDLEEVFA